MPEEEFLLDSDLEETDLGIEESLIEPEEVEPSLE